MVVVRALIRCNVTRFVIVRALLRCDVTELMLMKAELAYGQAFVDYVSIHGSRMRKEAMADAGTQRALCNWYVYIER